MPFGVRLEELMSESRLMIGTSDNFVGDASWPPGRYTDSTEMHIGMVFSMVTVSTNMYPVVTIFVILWGFVVMRMISSHLVPKHYSILSECFGMLA